jgi:hypothetical protein
MDVYVRLFCVCAVLCVQVTSLRRADPPPKGSYRMCIRLRNWKSAQDPTKGCRAIDRQTDAKGRSVSLAVANLGVTESINGDRAEEIPGAQYKIKKHWKHSALRTGWSGTGSGTGRGALCFLPWCNA